MYITSWGCLSNGEVASPTRRCTSLTAAAAAEKNWCSIGTLSPWHRLRHRNSHFLARAFGKMRLEGGGPTGGGPQSPLGVTAMRELHHDVARLHSVGCASGGSRRVVYPRAGCRRVPLAVCSHSVLSLFSESHLRCWCPLARACLLSSRSFQVIKLACRVAAPRGYAAIFHVSPGE